ncbi:DoxX family protein [Acinetobacter sp. TUM15071]|uniref:DoxX family protein n=1 Tax=Acinetobacter sp. TUM15071 TaxID=2609135 RepID=UPI00124E0BC1|nr:DoxX family protein [Acinetobacter sp. TUM15071]
MVDQKIAPYGIFILRFATGFALLAHSFYLKIFVFTMPGTVSFFESLGLPGILAWFTLAGEVITGLMLILGIKPRLGAILAAPIVLGATWAHSNNGWLFTNTGGGWEYPLFWFIVLVSIALLGDGAFTTVATNKKHSKKY